MTFKEAITERCTDYGRSNSARFIGYNTVFGSRMYGTLNGVSAEQCIETPVAENLMMGLAMGMCLEGYTPVVCFERHDFMLLAMDALVNHVDKMPWMSGGQFKFPIIIRAIAGGTSPIDPGPMHRQDYKGSLWSMLKHTPVYMPVSVKDLQYAWNKVGNTPSGAVVIIEFRDDYEINIPGTPPNNHGAG